MHNSVNGAPTRQVRVWDIPVRLFHWSVVALVATLFVTAELLDDAIELHAKAGYAVLALVLFRILWGFFGSRTARFIDFVRGPGTVLSYARTLPAREPHFIAGHNPLGGWMVVALLLGLLVQATLGLFSNDDILFDGPLSHLVTKETSDLLTGWHHELFDGLLILVVLHVAAVAFHKIYKGENLTLSMLTGNKPQPADDSTAPVTEKPLLALILIALSAGAVAVVLTML